MCVEQVLRYCYYLWLRLGNKRFEDLREFLTLPSPSTLKNMNLKMNVNGDGFQKNVFLELKKLLDSKASCPEDYEVILSWDATGYHKKLQYDKNTGALLGVDSDPERFSAHNMFDNQVNCFMVTSPQKKFNKLKFPVAYYHGSSLNSADIRRQVSEVMTGLDNIGVRVVCVVCDGASEHHKYFKMILDETSEFDNTIKVRQGLVWAVSDAPHLIKKFRNNWLASGFRSRHTRLLTKNGFHIGWSIMDAIYTVSTTLSNGRARHLTILPKLIFDVVSPTSIQRLRVSLAAIPFSKDVRNFVISNLDRLINESRLREGDIMLTFEYMSVVDELFQIMNSRYPITWTDTCDPSGSPIGLKDLCDTSKGHSLGFFSKIFGVSEKYLMDISGLPSPDSVPPPDMKLIIDRPSRLLKIAEYFTDWNTQIQSIPNLTSKQREKMFITHWLFTDLRRTCLSMVEMIKYYIPKSHRCWVPRRFNQDVIESTFGQIRNLAGSNTNMDRRTVNTGFSERRSVGLKDLHVKRT